VLPIFRSCLPHDTEMEHTLVPPILAACLLYLSRAEAATVEEGGLAGAG
jgi:hypothetical protein